MHLFLIKIEQLKLGIYFIFIYFLYFIFDAFRVLKDDRLS